MPIDALPPHGISNELFASRARRRTGKGGSSPESERRTGELNLLATEATEGRTSS